jgi:DNA segregation ATPase FtsK/SpoIIIE, S-DNA-T family
MTSTPDEITDAVRRDIRQARGITLARRRGLDRDLAHAEMTLAHEPALLAEPARRSLPGAAPAEPTEAEPEHLSADPVVHWAEVAAEAAPGVAGADWSQWPAEPETFDTQSYDTGPCLYRVGTVTGLEVPALVPLLDAGHLSITGGPSVQADAMVAALLIRIVATTRPGTVRISLFDPRRLGAGLGGFHALSRPGLLTVYGVDEFKDLLGSLDRDIRRIQRDVLGGGYASLAELAAATGTRPEPWRVVVVQSPVRGFRDEDVAHLNSVLHAGAACGIHVICRDVPVDADTDLEAIEVGVDGRIVTTMTGDSDVRTEPPPPELVRAVCERAARWAGVEQDPPLFKDLIPARLGGESSAAGVHAPIGAEVDRFGLVEVFMGDDPVHALVGGPPGSGKTNFLYALIGSLSARYTPDELEFYLLDFKEGVSFARLASGRTDKTWLPHARLIGVNINGDREFGLALLRHLGSELESRGAAARDHEVTKLEELRAKDPDGRWPRIIAVIDEFQVLIGQQDKITEEALYLLNDLARRGRSQGIHLVLASQNVGGVQSLWGRTAILDQFTLRVALPRARRVLAQDNPAADQISRFSAVVNAESGARQANRIVRLPDAGSKDTFDRLQRDLWQGRPSGLAPPRIFDGAHVPDLVSCPEFQEAVSAGGSAMGIVGQTIDLAGSAATVRFDRNPGRNLAVIGTRADEACDVLTAATLSLARFHRPGTVAFRLFCLDEVARSIVNRLARSLADDGHEPSVGDREDLPAVMGTTAEAVGVVRDGVEEYFVLFAVDAATARIGASVRSALRRVLERGPENGTHVLGWWRTVDRLKADAVEGAGAIRNIDAWVGLDVRDSELTPLPGGAGQRWSPRPRRALLYDQRTQGPPRPIIPFRTFEVDG